LNTGVSKRESALLEEARPKCHRAMVAGLTSDHSLQASGFYQNWLRLVILPLISILIFASEIHVYVHHLWGGNQLALAGRLAALKFMQRVIARAFNSRPVT